MVMMTKFSMNKDVFNCLYRECNAIVSASTSFCYWMECQLINYCHFIFSYSVLMKSQKMENKSKN